MFFPIILSFCKTYYLLVSIPVNIGDTIYQYFMAIVSLIHDVVPLGAT